MIHEALGRPTPVELTSDPRIRGRVERLAWVSAVALGLVLGLAAATLAASTWILAGLALGWTAMPAVLAGSLARPGARYLVVVPAGLVTLAMLAICVTALPSSTAAAIGWLAMTAGVLLGGGLGLWLWFRALPVPNALDDPLAHGRWGLIAVHAGLVVVGWLLAATALIA